MMGKMCFLMALSIVFSAFGSYEYDYDWDSQYSTGNLTSQVWAFEGYSNQPDSPFLPDLISENPGNPTLSVDYTPGLGAGWSSTYEGKTGVYRDPQGLGFTLSIPNYDVQNPLKVVVLKVGYRDAEFANELLISNGSVSLMDKNVELDVDGSGWNVLTAVWEIRPNPADETIQFDLSPVGTAAVDWIAVHTACVPEPATISLLVLGGIFVARRKK